MSWERLRKQKGGTKTGVTESGAEDEMVVWLHDSNGREFEQTQKLVKDRKRYTSVDGITKSDMTE